MRYGARHVRTSGADEALPSDYHRLSPCEVLRQRVQLCVEILTKAVEADDAPAEVRDFLVMGLDAMTEAWERLEGRR